MYIDKGIVWEGGKELPFHVRVASMHLTSQILTAVPDFIAFFFFVAFGVFFYNSSSWKFQPMLFLRSVYGSPQPEEFMSRMHKICRK